MFCLYRGDTYLTCELPILLKVSLERFSGANYKLFVALVGVRDAIHSLRWSGSKNKQGFLSLTAFTARVMSLGRVMGGVLSCTTGVKLAAAGSLCHLIGAYTVSALVRLAWEVRVD